ncbi:MAG: endo alpha-1,4 polygalactosaminidase [Spirochaetales bacterium]|nr:endo alpha-1,4 polygalactosaminidase [Spirochaetales bacterium]
MKKNLLIGAVLFLFLGCRLSVLQEAWADQPADALDTGGFVPQSFVYMIQGDVLPSAASISSDIVVIDYSKDGSDGQAYLTAEIAGLKSGGKKILSYLSIGEAESYRWYFQESWLNGVDQPVEEAPGWLGLTNPDWTGNYKVQYWAREWQEDYVFAYLDKIVAAGFDGVYLDIVDAWYYYSHLNCEGIRLTEEVAAREMILLVRRIAEYTRDANPNFIIVPQNGLPILDYDADNKFLQTISGYGVEDLFYKGTRKRSDSDIEYRLGYIKKLTDASKFVLVTDYVVNEDSPDAEKIADFKTLCSQNGLLAYPASKDRMLDEVLGY